MEEKGCELCIFLNIQGSQISFKKQELAFNIPVTSFLIYPLLPRTYWKQVKMGTARKQTFSSKRNITG